MKNWENKVSIKDVKERLKYKKREIREMARERDYVLITFLAGYIEALEDIIHE